MLFKSPTDSLSTLYVTLPKVFLMSSQNQCKNGLTLNGNDRKQRYSPIPLNYSKLTWKSTIQLSGEPLHFQYFDYYAMKLNVLVNFGTVIFGLVFLGLGVESLFQRVKNVHTSHDLDIFCLITWIFEIIDYLYYQSLPHYKHDIMLRLQYCLCRIRTTKKSYVRIITCYVTTSQ